MEDDERNKRAEGQDRVEHGRMETINERMMAVGACQGNRLVKTSTRIRMIVKDGEM
jgi:hypothetical protein